MTKDELAALRRGDLVRHVMSGTAYVIEQQPMNGHPALGLNSVRVSNAREWDIVNAHGAVISTPEKLLTKNEQAEVAMESARAHPRPGDIYQHSDRVMGQRRFYEVTAVCLGALGQVGLIGIKPLSEKPGVDTEGKVHETMWVPDPLFRATVQLYQKA